MDRELHTGGEGARLSAFSSVTFVSLIITIFQRVARSIYQAFKGDKRRPYLIPEDFDVAYNNHDDALAAFRVFDADRNGLSVSLSPHAYSVLTEDQYD